MSVQEEKLRAIADAIREKEGSSALISANDFSARIRALEAGSLPENVRVIFVEANVSSYGTVSGGGLASDGTRATVSAEAKNGYKFDRWTENGVSVSTEADYTFTVVKDRNLTAEFSVKTSRLPSGYTEVEYVQSDRACKIDTGVQPDLRYDRFVLDIEPTDVARISEEDIISMPIYRPSSASFYCFLWRNQSNLIYKRFSNESAGNSGIILGLERVIIDLNLRSKKIFIGDASFTAYSTSLSFAYGNNLCLFANGFSSTLGSIVAKLYSAQIYHSGALIRDFVPCIDSSGVAGLYDLIGNQFYKNAGTGALTAGPVV